MAESNIGPGVKIRMILIAILSANNAAVFVLLQETPTRILKVNKWGGIQFALPRGNR